MKVKIIRMRTCAIKINLKKDSKLRLLRLFLVIEAAVYSLYCEEDIKSICFKVLLCDLYTGY